MSKWHICIMALCAAAFFTSSAKAEPNEFSFGVIAYAALPSADEGSLRAALEEMDDENLAFVVANGIKTSNEPCSDALYQRRRSILQSSKHGVILSFAADDWATCRNELGRPNAVARLLRLREISSALNDLSMGQTKIPVTRQSSIAQFRSFSENIRWEVGNIVFATLNLPANNNHYVVDAGRNSEFEDRAVATQDWLNRMFSTATRARRDGIVIFTDGNPMPLKAGQTSKRDGYLEARRMIMKLASRYAGAVLIIHARAADTASEESEIVWQNNVGLLANVNGTLKITVSPTQAQRFFIAQ